MFRVRKTFRFEAAHILKSAYSKDCYNTIHGHSYVVEVFLTTPELNDDWMVIDFGELKDLIGELFERLDHALILPAASGLTDEAFPPNSKIIWWSGNPTAEAMAREFFLRIAGKLQSYAGVRVEKVRVHETTTGWAEYDES
jgi:6-pyruvoyltetrahydropterin/6-carboxytetrahydropterin synthase